MDYFLWHIFTEARKNYEITQTHHFICHGTLFLHEISYSESNKQSMFCWGGQYSICPVEAAGQSEVPPKKQGNMPRCSQAVNVKFRRGRQNVGNIFWSKQKKTLSFLTLNLAISMAINLSGCPATAMKENLLCLAALAGTLPTSSLRLPPALSTLKEHKN